MIAHYYNISTAHDYVWACILCMRACVCECVQQYQVMCQSFMAVRKCPINNLSGNSVIHLNNLLPNVGGRILHKCSSMSLISFNRCKESSG